MTLTAHDHIRNVAILLCVIKDYIFTDKDEHPTSLWCGYHSGYGKDSISLHGNKYHREITREYLKFTYCSTMKKEEDTLDAILNEVLSNEQFFDKEYRVLRLVNRRMKHKRRKELRGSVWYEYSGK